MSGPNLLKGMSRPLTPLPLSRKGRGRPKTVDSSFTLHLQPSPFTVYLLPALHKNRLLHKKSEVCTKTLNLRKAR